MSIFLKSNYKKIIYNKDDWFIVNCLNKKWLFLISLNVSYIGTSKVEDINRVFVKKKQRDL